VALFGIALCTIEVGAADTRLRTLLSKSSETEALVAPQANDTISQGYWAQVERQLAAAGANTPAPHMWSMQPPVPTAGPWRKVYEANQPYDAMIGAHIIRELTEQGTQTPPPTQLYVSQQFLAQCPLVMFGNSLYVRPPRSGEKTGVYADPATNRAVLRWKSAEDGGFMLGVDSVRTGDGSVLFANMRERLQLTGDIFELYNCLGVLRYTIEEKLVRVHSMGPGYTTMLMHDTSRGKPAFFMRYLIRHPNGTVVAKTNLFRQHASNVNFTLQQSEVADDPATGEIVAVAKRQGSWKGRGWRSKTSEAREWRISFPEATKSVDSAATVMDLRIAATAVITLMALRDETREITGLTYVGETSVAMELLSGWLQVIIFGVLAGLVLLAFQYYGANARMRVFLFQLEDRYMPKRSVKLRQPMLHPTW